MKKINPNFEELIIWCKLIATLWWNSMNGHFVWWVLTTPYIYIWRVITWGCLVWAIFTYVLAPFFIWWDSAMQYISNLIFG